MSRISEITATVLTSDMLLLDILSRWPATESVVRRYDEQAGVCLCCTCLFDTVQEVASRFSLDPEVFLSDIREAADATSEKTA